MSSLSSPNYIDINERFYSQDGKNLTKVNDISPYIRISAKCELIYNKCFYKLNSLISFTFEENPNLTIIGKESFYECQNITNINLSSCSKLKIISGYAFYRCLKVAEILLPRGLLEIHTFAFCVNGLVTNITIPASVEIIGQEGIYACRKLENVIFEEGSNLTSLEDHVFAETGITSFQIPEKVSYIHGWAFHDGQLTNLSLHPNNNYLIIENNNIVYSSNKSILFFICNKSFQTYEIPNTITTLGEYCLSYSDLKSITLPNSVTTIRSKSFTNSILTSVIIPKNVKSIGDNAFFRCYNLINVTFLGHLDYIGSGIFWDCLNLEHIIFPKSTMIISAHNFITIGVSKVCISLTNKALFSSLYAIRKNTNVSISYLNESNLIITSQLFIMNSNQTIIYEFWGFPKEYYNDIKIPNNVTTIKESAFENSTIKSINFELGSQLSIIEDYAFRNCSKLISFNFSSVLLNILGIESFKDCISLTSVSFASRSLVVRKNSFENCINLVEVINILSVSNNCFSGCRNLKNVNIIEDSRLIGYKAFMNCYNLESINIPSTVHSISEYSFLNCIKLKSINFTERNSLYIISNYLFTGCNSLKNFSDFESKKYRCVDNTLYSKNETGEYLIYHLNLSLDKTLIINCSVICSHSFNECNNIYNITILPNSVSLIEKYSFNNCLNLQHINFPLSVKTVESFSFNECHSIRCPLIIENTSADYLKMIIESGIPQHLIFSCHVVHNSNKFKILNDICNTSNKLFWTHLIK